MNSFKYTKDNLIKISSKGKRYYIDQYKVNVLETSIDAVIHFSDFDYRCEEMREWEILYEDQKLQTDDWTDRYYRIKELGQKQEVRTYEENQELRNKSAESISSIRERVSKLATECDNRLQRLEQIGRAHV